MKLAYLEKRGFQIIKRHFGISRTYERTRGGWGVGVFRAENYRYYEKKVGGYHLVLNMKVCTLEPEFHAGYCLEVRSGEMTIREFRYPEDFFRFNEHTNISDVTWAGEITVVISRMVERGFWTQILFELAEVYPEVKKEVTYWRI